MAEARAGLEGRDKEDGERGAAAGHVQVRELTGGTWRSQASF